jgi:hypothetical protein
MNLGTQTLREELILLNVVRASYLEPLNFTTLSKYTASGSVTASGTGSKNLGIDFAIFQPAGKTFNNATTIGSSPANVLGGSVGGSTANSFDVAPLDNSDFYGNFLQTLTPQNVNLLVNAGLSREVVIYSVVKAIDINLTSAGQAKFGFTRLRFANDPTQATWFGRGGKQEYDECEQEAQKDFDKLASIGHGGRWAPFESPFWLAPHLTDCSYQKARLLIEAALRFGVTTQAIARAQSGGQSAQIEFKKSEKAGQTIVVVSAQGSSSAASASSTKSGLGAGNVNVIMCFDPAIAAYYGVRLRNKDQMCPEGTVHTASKPGTSAKPAKSVPQTDNETLLTQPIPTNLGSYDASMTPILRSPYNVFQYFGSLLKTKRTPIVTQVAEQKTDSRLLFDVRSDWTSCFVRVTYNGDSYCVPHAEAGNTKEVLTVLIALVNMSTVRNSLPVTNSVIANPQ